MNIDSKLNRARELYEELSCSRMYEFSTLVPSMIPDNTPGVYAIYEKRTMKTLYVGKTTQLRQRLYRNHLMGSLNNARLKKYLIDDLEAFPEIKDIAEAKEWIKANCCFKFIVVKDYRERGHIEGLMSFLLDTKYVDIEH